MVGQHIGHIPRRQAINPEFRSTAHSSLTQHWPWLLAEGAIGVAVGLFALFHPALTVLAGALVLGMGLISQGVIGVVVSLRAGRGTTTWSKAWTGIFAVLSVVAGLLCLVHPGSGLIALVFGLGLWFVVVGINDLTRAGVEARHRGWNIVLGALSLIVAAALITEPATAIGTLAVVAGLGFILRGALDIALAAVIRHTTGMRGSANTTDSELS